MPAWMLAPASLPYVRDYVWNWNEAANFTADPFSDFLVSFFLTFLVMDIICCQLHYRDQVQRRLSSPAFLAPLFHP